MRSGLKLQDTTCTKRRSVEEWAGKEAQPFPSMGVWQIWPR